MTSLVFLLYSVHPATWFKVLFPPETKVVTFRPSALQPVDEEGRPFASYVVKPSISRGFTARTPDPPVTKASLQSRARATAAAAATSGMAPSVATAASAEGGVRAPSRKSSQHLTQLLGNTDPDSWLGRQVMVVTGRHLGQVGTVKSSGNGWVQVDTAFGEIAKRAAELSIVPANGSTDASTYFVPETEMSVADAEDDAASKGSENISARKRPLNTASESNAQGTKKPRHSSTYSRPGSSRNSASASSYNLSTAEYTLADEGLPVDAASFRFPVQSAAYLQARRDYVQQYVTKMQKKFKFRPNLSEWKVRLNASLFSDQVRAVQAARAFDESVCDACCLERWPGAKFCWNERCPTSPIYNSEYGTAEKIVASITSLGTSDTGSDAAEVATQSGSVIINPVASRMLQQQGPLSSSGVDAPLPYFYETMRASVSVPEDDGRSQTIAGDNHSVDLCDSMSVDSVAPALSSSTAANPSSAVAPSLRPVRDVKYLAAIQQKVQGQIKSQFLPYGLVSGKASPVSASPVSH